MDCDTNRMGDDRLTSLSDDLILKILSFVGAKDAIRTCVLSPGWRYLWTSIPGLSFSSEDFSTMDKLSNFVKLLSRHKNQLQLSSFNFYFGRKRTCRRIQTVVNRALSLNVQQMNITCFFGRNEYSCDERVAFPLSLSGSQTLKQLTLAGANFPYDEFVLTSAQEFSSLTTLRLHHVTLYDDGFFSMCPNLKDLILYYCKVIGSTILRICHPRLSNLTIEKGKPCTRTFSVVTPQLKNLSILKFKGKNYQVSAPKLVSLHFKGVCPQMFSTDGFPCLEIAHVSFHSFVKHVRSSYAPPIIISLIQQFHNVKHLSLSMEIIELLNSCVDMISRQPPRLANLESLTLLPHDPSFVVHKHTRVIISTEVKNYMLSSSPKATLIEGLLEECCDLPIGRLPNCPHLA